MRVQAVTSDIAEGLGITDTTGALVADVTANGPASKAGLESGDLIVGFDGKPVSDSRALPRIVADTPVGKTVSIDYMRKGQRTTAKVTVAKLEDDVASTDDSAAPKTTKPAPQKPAGSKLSQLGFSLGELDGTTRTKYHVGGDVQGVVVTDVDPDSPAGDKNFRAGDVIVAVQSQPVHSPDELAKRIDADARAGRKIELMLVSREGQLAYVAMPLGDAG